MTTLLQRTGCLVVSRLGPNPNTSTGTRPPRGTPLALKALYTIHRTVPQNTIEVAFAVRCQGEVPGDNTAVITVVMCLNLMQSAASLLS